MPATPVPASIGASPRRRLRQPFNGALWLAAALLAVLTAAAALLHAVHGAQLRHEALADHLAGALLDARPAQASLPAFLAAWAALQQPAQARIRDGDGPILATQALSHGRLPPLPAALGRALDWPSAPIERVLQLDGERRIVQVAARTDDLIAAQLPWVGLGWIAVLVMAGLGQAQLWRAQQRLARCVAADLARLRADEDGTADAGETEAQADTGTGTGTYTDSTAGPTAVASRPVAQPGSPEAEQVQALSDALRQALHRQRQLMLAQSEQLETLRLQAHNDALTDLPNRRHFLATLDATLGGDAAPQASGLLLLRLRDLQGLNQRIGRTATDHLLQALAETLRSYPQRMDHCLVGRLNGADFALWLPAAGLAGETAQALLQALRLPLCAIDPGASVSAGVLELTSPMRAAQALALVDAALAGAEAAGSFKWVAATMDDSSDDNAMPQGHDAWQRRIARALVQGRVALAAFPVRTADGRQLHLDCPLRVALTAQGPMEPASRWLSQAIRSRLCADVDEKTLQLALTAINRDGVARCINVASQSVSDPEFIAAVTRRLEAQPEAACRLWIDLPETLALERPALVRELSRRWRPLGVMLALEHAGEALPRLPRLMDLGLDCVRIDSRFVNGLQGPEAEAARRYLKGLVRLVQSVGLQASAEGVRSADDLAVLWHLGFDSATGPAVSPTPALAMAIT